MEAATTLFPQGVRIAAGRLVIDALIVEDPTAVRVVAERDHAGEDAIKTVLDAIEIGARVLDREHTELQADFVRTEFDRASRDVEEAFAQRAQGVVEQFGKQIDTVFGPESGHLSRALERHFSDDSSHAVQHRVRQLVADVMARSREDLLRQFSAADGQNPLADFKSSTVAALRQAGDRQELSLRQVVERMTALQLEVQGLRAERERLEEVAGERDRGTAKGRTFEEQVAAALDAIAVQQGDDCQPVGDLRGSSGKSGDVLVSIDGCNGPSRGRIVFEVKTGRLSRPEAVRELDRARAEREADFAVLVVAREEKVPAKMRPFREYGGDKMIVAFDPDADGSLGLEVAYALARARVLMSRSEGEGIDSAAIRDGVQRALDAMDDVRRIRSQLTGAKTSIDKADDYLVEMADRVRQRLRGIEALLSTADAPTLGI